VAELTIDCLVASLLKCSRLAEVYNVVTIGWSATEECGSRWFHGGNDVA
jgi:hypothetical protein